MHLNLSLKYSLILVSLIFFSSSIFAQSFNVGHTSIDFYDSARNRNVTTEIYYPADNTGENEPVATGNFPILIFGHGFLMTWEAYQNFWDELVPKGYVICFPTTEMGFMPDHQQFGQDLKFLATQLQIETQDNSSLFFNALALETALLGHSMGGGASFLAAKDNPDIKALINFAAAETTPSAISASNNVSVPTLMFSGEDDCVIPAEDHQNIMYENLNSDCKTQIKIVNGGHCYFANDNFTCSLGESFCNPNLSITRSEQQAVMFDFLNLWLDYSLKGNQEALTIFNDSLQNSNRINYLQQCNTVSTSNHNQFIAIDVFPNPSFEKLNVVLPIEYTGGLLTIYNLIGQQVFQHSILNPKTLIEISAYPKGAYLMTYQKDDIIKTNTFIKIDL